MDSLTPASTSDWERAAEVRALLLLEATPGIGLRRLRSLVEAFGSGAAALRAPHHAFARLAGRRASEARLAVAAARTVDAALERGRSAGIQTVAWDDQRYPRRLLHLADPPPVLFIQGDAGLLSRGGVTIIGSRRATARGREVAAELAGALGRHGVCVISGLALGIDAAAHRGALASGGGTLAVLGSGVDRPSPRSHDRLARRISQTGLLVSEFLPGTPPRPHHFPRRNRVLAALSEAVVVVEAGVRSGTLITVEHALDLGIDVLAVPGPEHRSSCAGSNRLLTEGAQPLSDPESFAAEFARAIGVGTAGSGSRPGRGAARARTVSGEGPFPGEGVSPASAPSLGPVLAALDRDAATLEQLLERTGLPVPSVVSVLSELEILGRVEQGPGRRYRRAS